MSDTYTIVFIDGPYDGFVRKLEHLPANIEISMKQFNGSFETAHYTKYSGFPMDFVYVYTSALDDYEIMEYQSSISAFDISMEKDAPNDSSKRLKRILGGPFRDTCALVTGVYMGTFAESVTYSIEEQLYKYEALILRKKDTSSGE